MASKNLDNVKKLLESADEYLERAEGFTKKINDNKGSFKISEVRKNLKEVKEGFDKK